jgi:nicotinate-nucleotide--dimethylbenzimidazole phosphoribosyltransferase
MTRPFDDLETLLSTFPGPDREAQRAAAAAIAGLGVGGRLAALAEWLAAWRGPAASRVNRPIVALYAAAHAGAEAGDGAARARLDTLAAGEGAVGMAAREFGAGVEAFDLAVDRPVPDAAVAATMSERECAATFAFGMEALAKTPDLLIVGETASGGVRAAGALAYALFGGQASDWSDEPAWAETAVARARREGAEAPLDLLRHLGGRETAALAGAIAAARTQRAPVLLDGYAAAAAAAVLEALQPGTLDHCQVVQAQGPGHRRLAERIGKAPLLDLGEAPPGVAGVAALGLVRIAAALQGPR